MLVCDKIAYEWNSQEYFFPFSIGYLDYGVMHRNYNYKDYYPWWDGPETKPVPTYPDDYEGMHEYPYVRHPNFREEWYPQYDFND